MRQELDSKDTEAFPEEEFGEAKSSNKARMVAIAQSFASQGARQEDPEHGINTPMNQRWAHRLNLASIFRPKNHELGLVGLIKRWDNQSCHHLLPKKIENKSTNQNQR